MSEYYEFVTRMGPIKNRFIVEASTKARAENNVKEGIMRRSIEDIEEINDVTPLKDENQSLRSFINQMCEERGIDFLVSTTKAVAVFEPK